MNELGIFKRLIDVEKREKASIRGNLKCDCGSEYFKVLYYGKRTKGILAADIIRNKGKIHMIAYCEACERSYGFNSVNKKQIEYNENNQPTSDLSPYDNNKYKLRFSFNYFPKNYKSSQFEYL